MVNVQHLKDMLSSQIGPRNFERAIALQAVDMNTGNVVIFDETTPHDKMAEAMRASAAIPIIFEPVLMDDMVLVDGGVFTNLDLNEAI